MSYVVRWAAENMPIPVFIHPFHWYQANKQREAEKYVQLVLDAMDAWSRASNGLIRFQAVDQPDPNGIRVSWRRVDRKYLGLCSWRNRPDGRMLKADVEIRISDGILFSRYQDKSEVGHTILHEFGHALGLAHSGDPADIMYVPHQYGVYHLSDSDRIALQWLYRLPPGIDYAAIGRMLGLPDPGDQYAVMRRLEQEESAWTSGRISGMLAHSPKRGMKVPDPLLSASRLIRIPLPQNRTVPLPYRYRPAV